MFGSFLPSLLVGSHHHSLLGAGSRHCYGIITLISPLAGDLSEMDEAIACYRKAIAAKPELQFIHSNLLFTLHYHADYDPKPSLPSTCAGPSNSVRPRLRTGRSSRSIAIRADACGLAMFPPDFREHVMGRYSEAVDRGPRPRPVRGFLLRQRGPCRRVDPARQSLGRPLALHRGAVGRPGRRPDPPGSDRSADRSGRPHRRQPPGGVRQEARADSGNAFRLPCHAPAWRPSITGSRTPIAIRPDRRSAFIPRSSCACRRCSGVTCRRPARRLAPLPARQAGQVTFGSFNNLAKVTEPMIGLWSQILRGLPESRMVVVTGAGSAGDERVLAAFARHGIGRERVTLVGRQRRDAYFRLYQERGHLPGHVSLYRVLYHGRCAVDGSARGQPGGRDVGDAARESPSWFRSDLRTW